MLLKNFKNILFILIVVKLLLLNCFFFFFIGLAFNKMMKTNMGHVGKKVTNPSDT